MQKHACCDIRRGVTQPACFGIPMHKTTNQFSCLLKRCVTCVLLQCIARSILLGDKSSVLLHCNARTNLFRCSLYCCSCSALHTQSNLFHWAIKSTGQSHNIWAVALQRIAKLRIPLCIEELAHDICDIALHCIVHLYACKS
jgi:hypothetical protein